MQQRCHGWRELQESSLAAVLGVCKGHVSFIFDFYIPFHRLIKTVQLSAHFDSLHAELLRASKPAMCLHWAPGACIAMQAMDPS